LGLSRSLEPSSGGTTASEVGMNDRSPSKSEEPDWAPGPMAWCACLANALPPAMVVIWLIGRLVAPVSAMLGICIYVAVLAAVVLALRPWPRR
jgi:hypothetical protein